MYEYLFGKIVKKRVDSVILDINNIGYKVFISLNTYEKIKDDKVKLYIYSHIREDAYVLYGFYSETERDFFEKLVNISGVGPKLAIAILSTFTVKDLKTIIYNNDINLLKKVPGLGPKKAQKLIFEIQDKIDYKFSLEENFETKDSIHINNLKDDIYLAMESLGYNKKDIDKFIDSTKINNYTSIEEAIKDILKTIQNKKR
ncbi:MAG: holliday junction helicase RuvA [Fusobacteriaceae bacterium]|jgi:Holliday junction DNA helicase RuvA|nr:Holliday junction helicase subunit RuvA [Fusobacteriales bacterium]MDN5304421.1 holliday junction helicase RuvA [Fusobacteriaceae bacterium]